MAKPATPLRSSASLRTTGMPFPVGPVGLGPVYMPPVPLGSRGNSPSRSPGPFSCGPSSPPSGSIPQPVANRTTDATLDNDNQHPSPRIRIDSFTLAWRQTQLDPPEVRQHRVPSPQGDRPLLQ